MAIKTNRGQLGAGLAEFLGIKGHLDLPFDPVALPVIQVGDLTTSPYADFGVPCGELGNVAAVAAENGFELVQPLPGWALQVLFIRLHNDTAAAKLTNVRMLTAADIATVGFTAERFPLVNLAARRAGEFAPAVNMRGTHTTAVVGNAFAALNAPIAGSDTLDLRDMRVVIYGDDPAGIGGVAVADSAVNASLTVTFLCRVWPLAG